MIHKLVQRIRARRRFNTLWDRQVQAVLDEIGHKGRLGDQAVYVTITGQATNRVRGHVWHRVP